MSLQNFVATFGLQWVGSGLQTRALQVSPLLANYPSVILKVIPDYVNVKFYESRFAGKSEAFLGVLASPDRPIYYSASNNMKDKDLREAIRQARLYILLTQELCKMPILEVARLAIEGGAEVLQLREKGAADPLQGPEEELLHLALELRKITQESNTLLIVNDNPYITLEAQADGLHLGQEDLPIKEARHLLGKDRLIGISVHNIDQARKAQEEGADYLGVGPVFPTPTKAQARAVGLELLRQVSQEIEIPCFAIGGINITNLEQVLSTDIKRVALCSAIVAQEDVQASTLLFAKRLYETSAKMQDRTVIARSESDEVMP